MIKITQSEYSNKKSAVINASKLNKRFEDLIAVNNVSFKIFPGEIVGILGPNGAGKTTTIRLLTGVFQLEKDSRLEINNQDIRTNPNKYKNNFGIVPEVSNTFSDYTVWQNLKFSAVVYGVSKEKFEKRSKEILKQFDLIDKINDKTKTLSKGLKQRLSFCLALLHEPSILILDEPTSGLDPFSVKMMRQQILQYKKEGKTVLITTHDMKEAQDICDRILIMNKGKIITDENPDELRRNFKSSLTIRLRINNNLSDEQKKAITGSFNLKKKKNGMYSFSSSNPLKDISQLYSISQKNDIEISDLKIEETSLEEVFIHMINKDSNESGRSER